MSLVKCSECGKEVSEQAKTCPNCGNPIKPNITDSVVQNLMTGFNRVIDNQFSHLLTKYFSLTTRLVFGLLVLVYLVGPFYKLKNGSSTIHKASLAQIFTDYNPDLSKGKIRRLVFDFDDEIISAHREPLLSLRGASQLVRIQYNPFRASLINLLLVLILLFAKVNKQLDYKLVYVISLMLIFSFLPIVGISNIWNLMLSSRSGYSGLSISLPAVNRSVFLTLILLIYSVILVIFKIANSNNQSFMQKIKDWIKLDTFMHSSLLILTGLYILFGHLTYYLSLPFFIYLLVFRKFGLFKGKKA